MATQATSERAKQLAQIVQKAAKDASFRKEFASNPKAVFQKEGVDFKGNYEVKVLENTRNTYHLVVPEEKLSPEHQQNQISGGASMEQVARFIITQIQENSAEKSQLLSNPAQVLRSKGVDVPQSVTVKVHQNTPETKYIVVPYHAGENDELSELELQAVAGGKGGSGGGLPGIPGIFPPILPM